MGYRSQVVVEIHGKQDSVHLLLKTYAMSETPEQIESANHILGPRYTYPNPPNAAINHDAYDLYYTEWDVNKTEKYMALAYAFDDVKWYSESQGAFNRLLDVADNLRAADDNVEVAIFFTRVGEDPDDVERDSYFDYDHHTQVANIQTRIDLDVGTKDAIDPEHFLKTLEPTHKYKEVYGQTVQPALSPALEEAEDVALHWNDLMMAIEKKEEVAA
jgi:hypothetical protein